jgi:hypothetical protein
VGGIAIDRRDNSVFIGYSTQSRLPDGSPDFEPAVVALEADGRLRWWSRLYPERLENPAGGYVQTSSPDQYVDHLAVDETHDRLLVVARSHGNQVINFWSGDAVAAAPGAHGYQNRFTGTSGNIHVSWLGAFALHSNALRAATWVAEYADPGGCATPSADPNMDGWPSPNCGWPDLNTTRVNDLTVDALGRPVLVGVGKRTVTTALAHQKDPKPAASVAAWNAFVRVYDADLSGVAYSSLLTGPWDPATGAGGDNTDLLAVAPLPGAVFVAGGHRADPTTLAAGGNPVPVAAVPAWASAAPSGASALFAALRVLP